MLLFQLVIRKGCFVLPYNWFLSKSFSKNSCWKIKWATVFDMKELHIILEEIVTRKCWCILLHFSYIVAWDFFLQFPILFGLLFLALNCSLLKYAMVQKVASNMGFPNQPSWTYSFLTLLIFCLLTNLWCLSRYNWTNILMIASINTVLACSSGINRWY